MYNGYADVDDLHVYVYCGNTPELRLQELVADVKITIQPENEKSCCIKKHKIVFTRHLDQTSFHIIADFGNFDELMKNYAVDGNFTIEADITIIKLLEIKRTKLRDFGEETRDVSDIVISVQDEKFHVSKMYLAAQSTHFKLLFENSNSSEIALDGIILQDFQKFLELLYGEAALTEDSVEGILQIAVRFDVPIFIRKCEDFLLQKSEFPLEKKLQMSMKYNLENLKNKCLSEVKSVADIRSVLPKDTKEMDPSVMAELLEKSLTLQKT